jgi:hypothetical protein
MSSSVSLHLQTSLDFIAHLDNRNYPAMADTMAPDFTHRFLPATLQGFGKPTRDKEEFIQHVKNLEPVFEKLNVLFHLLEPHYIPFIATDEGSAAVQYLPPLDIVESKDAVVLHVCIKAMPCCGPPKH